MTTIQKTPRSIQRVLAFVNRVRVATGQKPLKSLKKGKPNNSSLCPIAASFNGLANVSGATIEFSGLTGKQFTKVCKDLGVPKDEVGDNVEFYEAYGHAEIDLPKFCVEFVDRFDKGRIPELIA